MCVIIYKPEKKYLNDVDLEYAWASNPDGAGIAYRANNGGFKVIKGLMEYEDFLNTLLDIEDKELVIHFRYATHGKKIPEQTHPFAVSRNTINAKAYSRERTFQSLLFHNGVISEFGNKKYSDTLEFTSTVLAYLPDTQTKCKVLEMIGDKFVLLENNKIYLIGNFQKEDGVYYSNLHWKNITTKKSNKSKVVDHECDRCTKADCNGCNKWESWGSYHDRRDQEYIKTLDELFKN